MFGRSWRHPVPPVCPKCGYDLRGLGRMQCPECGYIPTFRELEEAARQSTEDLNTAEEARSDLRAGWYVGVGAIMVLIVSKLLGVGGLGMLVCVLGGLYMVVIGIRSTLDRRHQRLHQDQHADGLSGWLLILFGSALFLISFFL